MLSTLKLVAAMTFTAVVASAHAQGVIMQRNISLADQLK